MYIKLVFFAVVYFSLLGITIAFFLRRERKRKNTLNALKRHYQRLRSEREYFERNSDEHWRFEPSHYQALIRREAGIIICITMLFPEKYEWFEPELKFLVDKMDDSIIQ